MKRRYIDLNGLLAVANIVVAMLLVYAYRLIDDNPYVDQETIGLGLLLCLQTQVALMLERRRRDPFVILLAFETIFYYALRIFTLTLYPTSAVFFRFPFGVDDSNYALQFILIANLFLYGGLLAVRLGDGIAVDIAGWRAWTPGKVALLMAVSILFSYFSGGYWTEENIPRGLDFLALFLSANVIVLMALAYYFVFRRSLNGRMSLLFGALILVDMIVHTLTGSRSAILTVIQDCIWVGLAISGSIKIRRAHLLAGLAVLPVIATLAVASFVISTFNRASREVGTSFSLGRALELAGESGAAVSFGSDLELVLPGIFARTGFFDYSAEVIAHRAQYRSVINLPAYGKSIVDNILTPGFDVYDAPKVANSLQFIYEDTGTPSKRAIPDTYESDQLGIYGEFYALCGYACLPLLALMAAGLKWVYARLASPNPFFLVMKRVTVLFVYIELLRSFGIDWILGETLPLVGTIVLFSFCFRSRRTVPPVTAKQAAG